MRFWRFTLPDGTPAMTCPAALGYSFAAGTSDGPGAFDFTQGDSGKPDANPIWRVVSGLVKAPSPAQRACQGAKPILLDVGEMDAPYAWAPNIVDVQMLRVGQLVIIASPSEATTMSGRRWRAAVAAEARSFVDAEPVVVLGGPANTYAHYCTTPEEYAVQRYEGASTLYGPHELAAYVNLSVGAMAALRPGARAGDGPARGPAPPDNRARSLSLVPPVVVDGRPARSDFGHAVREPAPSYALGAVVGATFQAADPRNDLRLEGTFAAVERRAANGSWARVRDDADWFLVYTWRRTNWLLGHSEVDVAWETAGNAVAGTYRLRYYGDARSLGGGVRAFEGVSRSFELV